MLFHGFGWEGKQLGNTYTCLSRAKHDLHHFSHQSLPVAVERSHDTFHTLVSCQAVQCHYSTGLFKHFKIDSVQLMQWSYIQLLGFVCLFAFPNWTKNNRDNEGKRDNSAYSLEGHESQPHQPFCCKLALQWHI